MAHTLSDFHGRVTNMRARRDRRLRWLSDDERLLAVAAASFANEGIALIDPRA